MEEDNGSLSKRAVGLVCWLLRRQIQRRVAACAPRCSGAHSASSRRTRAAAARRRHGWMWCDENTDMFGASCVWETPRVAPPSHPATLYTRQPIYIESRAFTGKNPSTRTYIVLRGQGCVPERFRSQHLPHGSTRLKTRGTDAPPRPASLATKRARRETEQRGGAVAPTRYPRCPTTRTHASYTRPCYSSPLCDGKGSPPHSRSPLTQTGMSCTPYESPLCRSEVHSSFLSSWLSGQQPS